MSEKRLYEFKTINGLILYFFITAAMVGVSIYLTSHYFQVKFPDGLTEGSLCNLNGFFNCDKATNSHLSNIAGIPISIFGMLMGFFAMAGLALRNEEMEGTNHFLAFANAIGCVILFLYSLIVLHGLCPFCTIYYIFSLSLAYFFWKKSSIRTPSLKVLVIYTIIAAAVSYFAHSTIEEKSKAQNSVANDLIRQYYSLPNLGDPKNPSPYKIASASTSPAPIRIVIFSDFECPACKMLSEQMHALTERYQGNIDIQYSFYPLDHKCNPAMERPLHENACKAAYLASCLPQKFFEIHDLIFKNQETLSEKWLDDLAAKEGVTECMNNPKTKETVQNLIANSTPFNVRSTPTYLVNGVKIEGVLPLDQFMAILDEILKRHHEQK